MLDKTRPAKAVARPSDIPAKKKLPWSAACEFGLYAMSAHFLYRRVPKDIDRFNPLLGRMYDKYLFGRDYDRMPEGTIRRRSQTVINKHWISIKSDFGVIMPRIERAMAANIDQLKIVCSTLSAACDAGTMQGDMAAIMNVVEQDGFDATFEVPADIALRPMTEITPAALVNALNSLSAAINACRTVAPEAAKLAGSPRSTRPDAKPAVVPSALAVVAATPAKPATQIASTPPSPASPASSAAQPAKSTVADTPSKAAVIERTADAVKALAASAASAAATIPAPALGRSAVQPKGPSIVSAPVATTARLCISALSTDPKLETVVKRSLFNWLIPLHGQPLPREGLKGEPFQHVEDEITSEGRFVEMDNRSFWEMVVTQKGRGRDNSDLTTLVAVEAGTNNPHPRKLAIAQWDSGPKAATGLIQLPGFVSVLTDQKLISIARPGIPTETARYEDVFDAELLVHDVLDSGRTHPIVMVAASGMSAHLSAFREAAPGLAAYACATETAFRHIGSRLNVGETFARGDIHVIGFGEGGDLVRSTSSHKGGPTNDIVAFVSNALWASTVAAEQAGQGLAYRAYLRASASAAAMAPLANCDVAPLEDMPAADPAPASTGGVPEIMTAEAAAAGTFSDSEVLSLKDRVKELSDMVDLFSDEAAVADERAKDAEHQALILGQRCSTLEEKLKALGTDPDAGVVLPDTWDGFADFVDTHLAGRVVLSSRARRETKNPIYANPRLAAECLMWLAGPYRDGRLNGTDGSFQEHIMAGIKNVRCGNDAFDVTIGRQKHTIDWHLRSGGSTRDPKHCLRIYYTFDEVTSQVIIGQMPHHVSNHLT